MILIMIVSCLCKSINEVNKILDAFGAIGIFLAALAICGTIIAVSVISSKKK